MKYSRQVALSFCLAMTCILPSAQKDPDKYELRG